MERNIALVTCPSCDSVCFEGHDCDCQTVCAKCGTTFRASTVDYVTVEEFNELTANRIKHDSRGWTAFSKD